MRAAMGTLLDMILLRVAERHLYPISAAARNPAGLEIIC
jgi:hypothetical protein